MMWVVVLTACNNPSKGKDTAAAQIILYYNFLLSSSSRSPHPLMSICSSGITKYTQMYFRLMATIHLPPNRTFNKLLKCVFCKFFYILHSKTSSLKIINNFCFWLPFTSAFISSLWSYVRLPQRCRKGRLHNANDEIVENPNVCPSVAR